jgi:hypothetical protein
LAIRPRGKEFSSMDASFRGVLIGGYYAIEKEAGVKFR